MILWTCDLKRLGFRNQGRHYWQCTGGTGSDRYGLCEDSHLSIFVWTWHIRSVCCEVCEFHVTFRVPGHHLHFYYHEERPGQWRAAGFTSAAELAHLGFDAETLTTEADAIAEELVAAVDGVLLSRE